MLLPCVAESPDVELDVLNFILERAVAAFPHAIAIGKAVLETDPDDIYCFRDRIKQCCGENLKDSRLATHYAMLTACSLQVNLCVLRMHVYSMVVGR